MSDTAQTQEQVQQPAVQVSPKEQLTAVSERLNNLNTTRNTCIKLMESGVIKILDGNAPKEGEEPLSLDISGDIVQTILNPVLQIIGRRKEEFLAYKEQLLDTIEKGLTAEAK